MYGYFTVKQALWFYKKGIAIICNGDRLCTHSLWEGE